MLEFFYREFRYLWCEHFCWPRAQFVYVTVHPRIPARLMTI